MRLLLCRSSILNSVLLSLVLLLLLPEFSTGVLASPVPGGGGGDRRTPRGSSPSPPPQAQSPPSPGKSQRSNSRSNSRSGSPQARLLSPQPPSNQKRPQSPPQSPLQSPPRTRSQARTQAQGQTPLSRPLPPAKFVQPGQQPIDLHEWVQTWASTNRASGIHRTFATPARPPAPVRPQATKPADGTDLEQRLQLSSPPGQNTRWHNDGASVAPRPRTPGRGSPGIEVQSAGQEKNAQQGADQAANRDINPRDARGSPPQGPANLRKTNPWAWKRGVSMDSTARSPARRKKRGGIALMQGRSSTSPIAIAEGVHKEVDNSDASPTSGQNKLPSDKSQFTPSGRKRYHMLKPGPDASAAEKLAWQKHKAQKTPPKVERKVRRFADRLEFAPIGPPAPAQMIPVDPSLSAIMEIQRAVEAHRVMKSIESAARVSLATEATRVTQTSSLAGTSRTKTPKPPKPARKQFDWMGEVKALEEARIREAKGLIQGPAQAPVLRGPAARMPSPPRQSLLSLARQNSPSPEKIASSPMPGRSESAGKSPSAVLGIPIEDPSRWPSPPTLDFQASPARSSSSISGLRLDDWLKQNTRGPSPQRSVAMGLPPSSSGGGGGTIAPQRSKSQERWARATSPGSVGSPTRSPRPERPPSPFKQGDTTLLMSQWNQWQSDLGEASPTESDDREIIQNQFAQWQHPWG